MVSVTVPGPTPICVYLGEDITSSVDPFSHLIGFKDTSDVIVAVSITVDPYTTLPDSVVSVTVIEPE